MSTTAQVTRQTKKNVVISQDVVCRQCGGTGVNRFQNGRCIPCKGKGYLDVADQMQEEMHRKYTFAKGQVTKFDNMKRLSPALYETSVKSNPALENQLNEYRLLVTEYEKTRATRV